MVLLGYVWSMRGIERVETGGMHATVFSSVIFIAMCVSHCIYAAVDTTHV